MSTRWLALVVTAVGIGLSPVPPATAANASDPDTCRDLWEGVGLPRHARDGERDTTLVCHTRYVLSHNNETKTPDWVLERVPKSQVSGKFKRPKIKFRPDPNLDEGKRAVDDDYKGSKFDRGHQAPSDDFSANADWMEESFILSNIVPQIGVGFNQGIWKQLEDLTREVVRARGELYIVTGPVYRPEGGGKITIKGSTNTCGNEIVLDPPPKETICGSKANCTAGVAVPAGLFKIVYDPKMKRANAFIMPNMDHRDEPGSNNTVGYLKKFRTPVQVVEKYTGLEFFPDLPMRERRPRLEPCATMMLH